MSKTIRLRRRTQSSPRVNHAQEWHEYQVVEGRKILGRYDFLSQALSSHPEATPDESCNP